MLTVLENQSLAAGTRRIVTDNGSRDITIHASSVGTWTRRGQAIPRLFGNLQSGYYATVAVFELSEPCEDATLIVDGVTDNAGFIVGV